jgi:hypothetical protein
VMFTEWLMEHCGWRDIWFLGSNGLRRGPFRFVGPGVCFVGVWTGPDRDLLCVKECQTSDEAERWLSPAGWTVAHAAIRSYLKLVNPPRAKSTGTSVTIPA